jgi:hypothetical protein
MVDNHRDVEAVVTVDVEIICKVAEAVRMVVEEMVAVVIYQQSNIVKRQMVMYQVHRANRMPDVAQELVSTLAVADMVPEEVEIDY